MASNIYRKSYVELYVEKQNFQFYDYYVLYIKYMKYSNYSVNMLQQYVKFKYHKKLPIGLSKSNV